LHFTTNFLAASIFSENSMGLNERLHHRRLASKPPRA
jgi:hypothetical protein